MIRLLEDKGYASVLLVSIAATIALGSPTVLAQSIRQFETYREALNSLLRLDAGGCNLDETPADLNVRIGPNLSRHCDKDPVNVMSGSVLGGSLVSPQSTRTVSQFGLRPRRTERPRRERPKASSFVARDYWIGDTFERWLFPVDSDPAASPNLLMNLNAVDDFPTGELRIVGDQLSIFATFEHQRVDRRQTAFESGLEYQHNKATFGFGYRVAPSLVVGASGFYKRTDGDFDKTKTSVVTNFKQTVSFQYQPACGQPSGGDFDANEYGGNVFAITRLGEAGFIFATFGGAAFDQSYAQSLCLQSNDSSSVNLAEEVYSGTLKGSPEGRRFEAQIRGGYDIVTGPLIMGPRVGLDLSWTKVDSYSESEFSEPRASTLFSGTATTVPTGAALRYEDQDFTSLQSRLGLIIALPVASKVWILTPFIEGTYIYEFKNEQRKIEARFVEDFRANPTVFSFKTNAPDRNFFELGGGMSAQFSEDVEVFVSGKAVLENSLFDSYSIQAALRLKF